MQKQQCNDLFYLFQGMQWSFTAVIICPLICVIFSIHFMLYVALYFQLKVRLELDGNRTFEAKTWHISLTNFIWVETEVACYDLSPEEWKNVISLISIVTKAGWKTIAKRFWAKRFKRFWAKSKRPKVLTWQHNIFLKYERKCLNLANPLRNETET